MSSGLDKTHLLQFVGQIIIMMHVSCVVLRKVQGHFTLKHSNILHTVSQLLRSQSTTLDMIGMIPFHNLFLKNHSTKDTRMAPVTPYPRAIKGKIRFEYPNDIPSVIGVCPIGCFCFLENHFCRSLSIVPDCFSLMK